MFHKFLFSLPRVELRVDSARAACKDCIVLDDAVDRMPLALFGQLVGLKKYSSSVLLARSLKRHINSVETIENNLEQELRDGKELREASLEIKALLLMVGSPAVCKCQ